jgi:hypothetical protein
VIAAVLEDVLGAVELFDQEEAGHVVGEGHGGEAEAEVGRSL